MLLLREFDTLLLDLRRIENMFEVRKAFVGSESKCLIVIFFLIQSLRGWLIEATKWARGPMTPNYPDLG